LQLKQTTLLPFVFLVDGNLRLILGLSRSHLISLRLIFLSRPRSFPVFCSRHGLLPVLAQFAVQKLRRSLFLLQSPGAESIRRLILQLRVLVLRRVCEDFVSISAAEGIRSALPPCSVRCYCSCPRSSSGPWCAPFCLLMSRERRSVRITCSLCCLILRGFFYVEVGIVFELSDQKIKFF
jgi:hypothetical protein